MLPQKYRRRWYHGWHYCAGITSLIATLLWIVFNYPIEPNGYLFAPPVEGIFVAVVAAAIGAIVWLPIAYWTWRPYVPTEPGDQ